MARLNSDPAGSSVRGSSVYEDTPTAARTRRTRSERTQTYTASPGPTSDKENSGQAAETRKRNSGSMAPPARTTPAADARGAKRRRLGEMNGDTPNGKADPGQWYDPIQPESERSEVTQGYRSIQNRMNDKGEQLLKPNNNDLLGFVHETNDLMPRVKQTNTATMDSKVMTTITGIALKKVTNMVLGDGHTGVDVDDFIAKCKQFMLYGGPPREIDEDDTPRPAQSSASNGTQKRRTTRTQRRADEEDGDEELDSGDALPWDLLGEQACFPNNSRPPVPSFLLGPLSVQKRARASTQRRARLQQSQQPKTQPKTLESEDLERAENSNLTTLCKNIRKRLSVIVEEGQAFVEEGWEDDATEEEQAQLLDQAHLASNGGVSLFKFAINPSSFGQTVENLFYISFLIREGSIAVGKDNDELPTLGPSESRSLAKQREQNISKHQAVFSLDWAMWEELKKAFEVKEPLIPHRADEHDAQVSARGWYG